MERKVSPAEEYLRFLEQVNTAEATEGFEILQHFEKKLSEDPDNETICEDLRSIYLVAGDTLCKCSIVDGNLSSFDAALSFWRRAVELSYVSPRQTLNYNEDYLRLLYQLALGNEIKNNHSQAHQFFYSAVIHDSNNPLRALRGPTISPLGDCLTTFTSPEGKFRFHVPLTKLLWSTRDKLLEVAKPENIIARLQVEQDFWSTMGQLVPQHLSSAATLHIESNVEIARIFLRCGQKDEAVRALNRAIRAEEDFEIELYDKFHECCCDILTSHGWNEAEADRALVRLHFSKYGLQENQRQILVGTRLAQEKQRAYEEKAALSRFSVGLLDGV